MQRFNHDGKWIGAEQMREITLKRQNSASSVASDEAEQVENKSEVKNEETNNDTNVSNEAVKLDRKAIVAELKALGIEFKGNTKTIDLAELLEKSKTSEINETETNASDEA